MAENETINTMFQAAFVKNGPGDYSLKTSGGGGGGGTVKIDPTGNTIKIDQTSPNNVVQSPDVANQYTSLSNANTTTAPAQFAVLANITIANAGYYQIAATYGFGSTAEATASDNFQLVVNSTGVTLLPAPVGTNNTLFPRQVFKLKFVANDVVKIICPNAGSANSVYKTLLVADRLS